MHRRYGQSNIPTEVIRTLIVISETGTFTGAGERLHLSQAAVSAQMKRLQAMTGGKIFEKAAGGGVHLSERGQIILSHARRMLDANDQILSLGGTPNSNGVRLGISPLYAEILLSQWASIGATEPVQIHCDQSSEIAKMLVNGYVDIACVLSPISEYAVEVKSWMEDHVWLKARTFALSPGAPIPVVCWPGSIADQPAISALEARSQPYRVAFTSQDVRARLAAVRAGLGLMATSSNLADEQVVIASDYFLPPLKPRTGGIYLREGFDCSRARQVLDLLEALQPGSHLRSARKGSSQ